MSITGGLVSGITGVTFTGGASVPFLRDGTQIPNGVRFVEDSVEPIEHAVLVIKTRPAKFNAATGSFSKVKSEFSISKPAQLSDGSYVYNTVRFVTEFHPQTAIASMSSLIDMAMTIEDEMARGIYTGTVRIGAVPQE